MKNWFKPINQQLNKAKLSNTDWGLLTALFLSLSLGQLQRISLTSTISFYFHDVLICTWLVINWQLLWSHFKKITWRKYGLELFFIAWVILGMSLTLMDLAPWLYLIRLVVYSLFLLCLWIKFDQASLALRILTTSLGFLFIWYGLLQYLFFPDLRFLFTLGWDDHYYRLAGTVFDPNFFGILTVLTFIYIYSLKKVILPKLWWSLLAIYISAITLTYSRASYLSLLIVIGLLWLFPQGLQIKPNFLDKSKRTKYWHNLIYVLAAVAIGTITYLIAPKPGGEGVDLTRTASINSRAESSQMALADLDTHDLIIGKGFYNWQTIHQSAPTELPSHARVPDNIFVNIFASTGIVGLLLVVLLLIKYLPRIARGDWLIFLALAAVIMHAQFNNTFLEPFVFLFLGLGFASTNLGRKKAIQL